MFSDKYRILTIVITVALILAGCFYSAKQGPLEDPSPEVFLNNSTNIGSEIIVRYAKVKNVSDYSALLESLGYEFTANFEKPIDFQAGADLSFTGTVVSSYIVDVKEYHIHPWRPLKYYISLPAIALVIYILFKKYRFNWRRFMFFEK